MGKHKFSCCNKCLVTIYNPLCSRECALCGEPYSENLSLYIGDDKWVAFMIENYVCFFLGSFHLKEDAAHCASLDYERRKFIKEPLSLELAIRVPSNLTKYGILHLFYGIKSNAEVERELSIHGRFDKSERTWKIGKAQQLLINTI